MNKEDIIRAYDSMAERYSSKIENNAHNAFCERPALLGLLPNDLQGKKILDAGCGPGKYAEILIAKGAKVLGFDISPSMIEIAKNRNKGRGVFFIHDLSEPLEMLEDESFDIIISSLALHYIEDWHPVFREFKRVLRPGGKFIFSVQHPISDLQYYPCNNYFDIEPVSATWEGFGDPIDVPCFRRPFAACIEPIYTAGLQLLNIVETRPLETLKDIDPNRYEKLNRFPSFICFGVGRI